MRLFKKKEDQRIAAYQRELIETHYAEVENMYRQIRGWRHDYRNHIQTLKAYAASGNMVCEYCDSFFTPEECKAANEQMTAQAKENAPKEEEFENGNSLYSCPSCGAEIMADANTAATFCYYCHNPVILQ